MNPVRIVIADDHALIRHGLRLLLAREPGFEIVAEAADGYEAVAAVTRHVPDVAILDVGMPNMNGIEAARRISSSLPAVRIVILTIHSEECYLVGALKAGASAYVLKNSADSEIADAVRAVNCGKAFFSPKICGILASEYTKRREQSEDADGSGVLTSRERQILQLLAEGQSNKEIAGILNLSVTTVISHRQHIFHKLNLRNLAELILYALRTGVIFPQRDRSMAGSGL